VKEQLIDMVQSEPFSPIHIKAASGSQADVPKED
jgi:chromatin segregation and condensation protein Rec8/ScpA/Scc1 (kleisin family)